MRQRIYIFMVRILCIVGILLYGCSRLSAQGTNDEMIIVKEYEAKVRDADKITIPLTIPDSTDRKPTLSYSNPKREFKEIAFEPNPLKPIGIPREKLERYNSSYIKLGFGSQLTPLVELAYNNHNNPLIHYGVFYNHISQYGFHLRNQKYSDDEVGIYLRYYPGKLEFKPSFTFHNLRTHFYGNGGDTMDGGAVLQNLQHYDLSLRLRNVAKNKAGIDFTALVRTQYMRETYGGGHEYAVDGRFDATYRFKKYHSFGGGIEADISGYQSALRDTFRDLIFLRARYEFNNDDWRIRGGLAMALDKDQAYPLPDLYVEKRLYEHKLIVFAGWEIRFQKNSFSTLSAQNNFILSAIDLRNTRISDLNAGLKGTVGGLSYMAKFSFKNIANMPFYISDTVDVKRFYVTYEDRMTALGGSVELGYNHQDIFRLLLNVDINSYSTTQNTHAWYEPVFKGKLSASYNINRKIIIGAYLYAFSDYYGKVGGVATSFGGTVDAGLSLDYLLSKRVSFFGRLNNLAHQRYMVYAGYPVYGMNGIVGVKFSF